jgi:hypothetical protein
MQVDVTLAAAPFSAGPADEAWRLQGLPPLPCYALAEHGLPAVPGGMTPLMAASVSGCAALVQLLLRCGADPARRDARGHTAAFYARAAGHLHLADRLDRMADPERALQ